MKITEDMISEDEKRWHARDIITELGYCGNYMRDRKDMRNTDIRFYAYIMRKAYTMLKKYEHRETFIVIDNKTGEEADTYEIALHEDWAKHLCYCDIEGWAIEEDGTLLLVDECGRLAYADKERFKVKWE